MSEFHISVLPKEVLDALEVGENKKYIDATLGGGGHTIAIAEKGGVVLGIDVDTDAIGNFEQRMKGSESRIKESVRVVKGNFAQIGEIAKENGFTEVSGILFDLGVSSHQFDTAERGFSHQKNGPLDMRMDDSLSIRAADLVNGLTKKELELLFKRYGEEPFAKKIAEAIVNGRNRELFTTTDELARAVERAVGRKGKIHPATRVFQALRIAVNDELHSLENALLQSVSLLESGGRIVVISFHSLEDRIIKQTFLQFVDQGLGSLTIKKPLLPTEQEILENPRARSAKLRIFQKN